MRKKVAVFFGGRSLESDISVITAMQALSVIDRAKYIIEPIYMFEGDFYVKDLDNIEEFVGFDPKRHRRALLYKGAFYTLRRSVMSKFFKPDCALICCHGGEGENGVLQALLQYNGIPYTSAGVLQSACGMDKTLLKRVFESMSLNVLPYCTLLRREFKDDETKCVENVESRLSYPLIVKPSSQGSSIGIEVAKNSAELTYALNVAFSFDNVAIIERKLENFTEVNCAVYRHKDEIIVSATEEPTFDSEILTFDEKYMAGGKMSGGGHVIPANIGELNDIVRKATLKIYNELNLDGVVRVDYLVDNEQNMVYVNEINTIPGSLAFYLFESRGITFEKLLDDLIDNAFCVGSDVRRVYKSNVLTHFANGGKIRK